MIIFISKGNAFDKIQDPFMTKTLNKLGTEGKSLSLVSGIYEKPTAHIIFSSEKLHASPLRLGRGKRWARRSAFTTAKYSMLYWRVQPVQSCKKKK